MEKELVLKAEVRECCGSRHSEKVRSKGRIPVIVYGHKEEPIPLSLDAHSFIEGLHHGRRLMDVQIGDEREKVIVKDLQYDYLGKNVIHADLVRVDVTEIVAVEVPMELKGTAKGAEEGGIITEHLDSLEVECKVTDIPERIIISVKEMEVGDNLHAGDVELPMGVKLLTDAEALLVSCSVVSEAKTTEELEGEEPAAPEVIGEIKEEETESGPSEGEGRKENPA